MTLEQHRSNLFPEVSFSRDGTILFATPEGHTSLSQRQEAYNQLPASDTIYVIPTESPMDILGHKHDSNNNRKQRYKQRGSLMSVDPISIAGSGSVSTVSSSLLRRLRQSKSVRMADGKEKWQTGSSAELRSPPDSVHSSQSKQNRKSWSSFMDSLHSKKRQSLPNSKTAPSRFSRGKPQLTPEIAASLNLDVTSLNSPNGSLTSNKSSSGRSQNLATLYGRFSRGGLNLIDQPQRNRRFTEERLPYIVFLIIGPLLITVGIIRLVISIWNEFGNGVWAGVPVLVLGIVGHFHHHNYTHKLRNGLYISFGLMSSVAVMVSSGFTLFVLVPMLHTVILFDSSEAEVLANVVFSNHHNETLPHVKVTNQVTLTIILDLLTLLLLAVGFYSQTATVIAIDNYWGTNFDITGECDHRGRPRLFNPLEQMSIGQVAVFAGLVEMAMIDTVAPESTVVQGFDMKSYGWTMVWDGVIVILAGFLSMCFGKRVDLRHLGIVAMVGELVGLIACTAACIFTTMSIALVVTANSPGNEKTTVPVIVIGLIYFLVMVTNIIFIVGILFRQSQQVCSCCCSSGPDAEQRNRMHFGQPVNDYRI